MNASKDKICKTMCNRLSMDSGNSGGALFVGAGRRNPAKLDSEAVIDHLNAIITLYRNASAELQTGGAPSDVIYQDCCGRLPPSTISTAKTSSASTAISKRS
ncbi:MAG: hypothetical protein M3P45_00690 [Acidobacteriota bacterium]|nr:hypothetical protein [Acidobacteriota bacterium]